MNRKWINNMVEPMREGWLSKVYDFIMLIAIIIGTVPLLFREYRPLFLYFDLVSGIIYMVDYILRWMTCDLRTDKPKWKAFLLYPITPMAILDLLSILPTFTLLDPAFKLTKAMRLLKIIRFTKIVRYFAPLDIFVTVLGKQWKLLTAVLVVAFFDILITAIIMFQSEHEIDPVTGEYIFKTFYDAFYWAAITMSTVGYGDLHPVTDLGKTLSIISSLLGIGIIALPSSIITAGYMQELNKRMKEEEEAEKENGIVTRPEDHSSPPQVPSQNNRTVIK